MGKATLSGCIATGAAFLFVGTFAYLAIQRFNQYGVSAFDVGIYDQAFWLLSKGQTPFITLRGMNMWAHHINLVGYLYAPFYWMGAGIRFLLISQAVVLGLGAFPVYQLAKRRFGAGWMCTAVAIAYLLSAPLEWLTLQTYHPEALAITPILFAVWYAEAHRWTAFTIATALALSTREEAGLALGLICLRLAIGAYRSTQPRGLSRLQRMRSLPVLVPVLGAFSCILWFVLCTKVIIPHFNNHQDPYYIQRFYGQWGKTTGEVLRSVLTHPGQVVKFLFRETNVLYVVLLFWCLGGLGILSPSWFVLAGPFLFWNAISAHDNTRSIQFQYTIFILPALTIASLQGLAKLMRAPNRPPTDSLHAELTHPDLLAAGITRRTNTISAATSPRYGRQVWVLLAGVCVLATHFSFSPSPLSALASQARQGTPQPTTVDHAMSLIKPTDRVSADAYFGAHVPHSQTVYEFPNPFVPAQFGPNEETEVNPNAVNKIVVWSSYKNWSERQQRTLDFLLKNGYYKVDFRSTHVLVATRVIEIPEQAISKFRKENPYVDRDFANKKLG
jgi:uncharacterized membrane protein